VYISLALLPLMNFINNPGISSLGIPMPLSSIDMITLFSFFVNLKEIKPSENKI